MCECSNQYVSWDCKRELFYCTKCGEEIKQNWNEKMTKVNCKMNLCKFNKDGICDSNEININGYGECYHKVNEL